MKQVRRAAVSDSHSPRNTFLEHSVAIRPNAINPALWG